MHFKAALFCLIGFASSMSASEWAHELTKLQKHADYHYQRLENGFKYAYYQKASVAKEPGHTCLIRFHIDVGSLQEQEHEQGLVYLLHMLAFRHNSFMQPSLLEYLQSMGLKLQKNFDASTNLRETLFKFDIIDNCDQSSLERILLAVRAIADGLIFSKEDIDKQSLIIQRAEESQQQQHPIDVLFRLLPELEIAQPFGVKAIRDKFNVSLIRQFYDKHYVARAMKLVVVSDLPNLHANMDDMAIKFFSTLKPRTFLPPKKTYVPIINPVHQFICDGSIVKEMSFYGRRQKAEVRPRSLQDIIQHHKQAIVADLVHQRVRTRIGQEAEECSVSIIDQDIIYNNCFHVALQEARAPLKGLLCHCFGSSESNLKFIAALELMVAEALATGFSSSELIAVINEYTDRITQRAQLTDLNIHLESLVNDARKFLPPVDLKTLQSFVVPALKTMTETEAMLILKNLWSGTETTFILSKNPLMPPETFIRQAIDTAKQNLVGTKN